MSSSIPPPAASPRFGAPSRIVFLIALALFIFTIFSITSSKWAFGYEWENRQKAEDWLTGQSTLPGRIGILEIVPYVPSALVRKWLAPTGRLQSLQHIIYNFVNPLMATLICLALLGLVYELHRRLSTASALALILAFCTMIWPYSKFGMENHQTLWTLAAAWALIRYVRQPGSLGAVMFSLCLIALVFTKMTGLLLCAAFCLAAIWLIVTKKIHCQPGFAKQLGIGLFLGAIGLALLLISNHARYGSWLHGGRYSIADELRFNSPIEMLAIILISPGKSIFLYSPALLIGLWHWQRFFRRFAEMRAIFVCLGLVTAWYLLQTSFFADETWGPRRLHFLIPFLCLPLGCWWEERKQHSRIWLWLANSVLLVGVLIQLLAVSFNYTSHYFVLARSPIYSVDNYVWLPNLSHLNFNLHLYKSAISKARGKGSVDFVFEQDWIKWHEPKEPGVKPEPLRFDVSQEDYLDIWWLEERERWSPKPFWFSKAASYVALLFFLLALILPFALARYWPRDESG